MIVKCTGEGGGHLHERRGHRYSAAMKMLPPLLLSATLLLASAAPVLAGDDPSLPFDTFTLPNGLQVILSLDKRLPLVSVNTWYHVGAVNEVPGRSGFAHLFEHIMFQGSRNVAEDTFFRYLEGAGATLINGTTDFDRTNYFETLPAGQLELALWLESDRMGYLLDTLTQERLDNQKAVVRKERQQSVENAPYVPGEEKLFQMMFPAPHPYYGYVIGSHEELEAATLEDVRGFFRSYYAPNNATVAIVGDFDPTKVRELVTKYYGDIPRGGEVPARSVKTEPITQERRAVVPDEVELPKVFMAWVTPRIFTPGDADLQLAASILGQGKTSRLYQKLVYQDRIAQEVNATVYPMMEGSVMVLEILGKKGQTPEALEAATWNVVEGMRVAPASADELRQAQVSHEAEVMRGLERLGGFEGKGDLLNMYNHHLQDPGFLPKDLARFRAVTPISIQKYMSEVLTPQSRSVVHVVPVSAGAPSAAPKESQ